MKNFPIQDLNKLQEEYADLMEDYSSLEEIFNEALEKMDFNKYYEDQEMYESYLLKFNHIEEQMKLFKKNLDTIKSQISN